MNSFVKYLLTKTSFPLYINSLRNPDNPDTEITERNVHTRDEEQIEDFVERHNVPGKGVFFCVGMFPRDKRRAKDNVVEVPLIHLDVDAKDLDISLDEVRKKLQEAKLPPSIIVSSGRGIHAYWKLKTPTKDLITHASVIKGLARIFAGDPVVTHAAALMRLPGTTNSKGGASLPVTILEENDKTYTLKALADFVVTSGPSILRKSDDPNNVVEIGGYMERPPVDVEGRLAAMTHGGVGDSGVHATQLSVTASMISSGVPIDEVVATVLEATQAAVSADWDWNKEEADIRHMCNEWARKHPPQQAIAQVIQMDQAKAEKSTAKAKKSSKEQLYHDMAVKVKLYLKNSEKPLLKIGDEQTQIYFYSDGVWKQFSTPKDLNFHLNSIIEKVCGANGILTNTKTVHEIRRIFLDKTIDHATNIEWDNTDYIPFENGLYDYNADEIYPHKPENYLTRKIERFYRSEEDCPYWKQMLRDAFPGEDDVISTMQEIAGAGLLSKKSRSLMTALVLVGPAASGKSSILEVLGKLYSKNRVSTPIDQLEKSHGTMAFMSQHPWVLDEAFDTSTWHTSKTIKALLTGEGIDVNIKNGPMITVQYRAPIFWGANVMPQFKEMTEAIKKRLTVVRCNQIFDMKNPIGVAKIALEKGYWSPAELVTSEELPGVINWAIEGLNRAIANGKFSSPASIEEAAELIHESGNYAIEFLRECTEASSHHMVRNSDLHGVFNHWWLENRGEGRFVPSQQGLITAIVSLHRKDLQKSPDKFNNHRHLLGIKLSEAGKDYWMAASQEAINRNTVKRYSASLEELDVLIPPKWAHIVKKASEDTDA